jgi:hypothetical protein
VRVDNAGTEMIAHRLTCLHWGLCLATYKIKFFVETSLSPDSRLNLPYLDASILLHPRKQDSTGISAELQVEANDYKLAITRAQDEYLYPALDALSFHRNATCLVSHFEQVLKNEKGSKQRRLIQLDATASPDFCHLDAQIISEVASFTEPLSQFPGTVVRWLRNVYRPITPVERFMYSWLALENLAGPALRRSQCNCGETLRCTKCDKPAPEYLTGNRDAAFEIVKGEGVDRTTFLHWWNGLRNGVFHGGKKLDTKFINELEAASRMIIPSVEAALQKRLGCEIKYRTKRTIHPEYIVHMHHFMEFEATKLDEEFPSEIPPFDASIVQLREQKEFDNW